MYVPVLGLGVAIAGGGLEMRAGIVVIGPAVVGGKMCVAGTPMVWG